MGSFLLTDDFEIDKQVLGADLESLRLVAISLYYANFKLVIIFVKLVIIFVRFIQLEEFSRIWVIQPGEFSRIWVGSTINCFILDNEIRDYDCVPLVAGRSLIYHAFDFALKSPNNNVKLGSRLAKKFSKFIRNTSNLLGVSLEER